MYKLVQLPPEFSLMTLLNGLLENRIVPIGMASLLSYLRSINGRAKLNIIKNRMFAAPRGHREEAQFAGSRGP